MNIIERGRAFRAKLRAWAGRSAWDWKRCPRCGNTWTIKYGTYLRHPWFLTERRTVRVQRHLCHACERTYSERSPLLVRHSWYAREVHRAAIDHWQHLGLSLRRTAEVLRSWMGRQERWRLWRPLDGPPQEVCYLAASTVHRWLDWAGVQAQDGVPEQLAGIGAGQVMGTDGLWAKLTGDAKRVVLLLVDSVTGLLYPPVVTTGEESATAWQQLFKRAQEAGLDLEGLRAVTSDGAQGLLSYMRAGLVWVQQQRCVWHLWRNARRPIAKAAAQVAEGRDAAAKAIRARVRGELRQLVGRVINATGDDAAETALQALLAHPQGAAVGRWLSPFVGPLLVHQMPYCAGTQRVSPEWCWRDFRLRLSHGRNHRSEERVARAALVWAVYHNFEPAQWRSEQQRQYRHPGQSALQVAGVDPGEVSYLDALGV